MADTRRRLLLIMIILGICGVVFWCSYARKNLKDLSRDDNLKLIRVSYLNLDNEIEKDLNTCRDRYRDDNAYKNTLCILQEYIPANYSTEFKNPCWYDFYQIPASSVLQPKKSKCIFGVSNTSVAKQVLDEVKHSSKKQLFCLPAFFMLGFPKCASTALYRMITQHPLLAQGRCKEYRFWTNIAAMKDAEMKRAYTLYYFNLFSESIQAIQSNPLRITLDASVTYGNTNGAMFCALPTLLMRVLPEAKFIFIMRNPSERFFSHYWYISIRKTIILHKTKLFQYAHSRKALEVFHNYAVDAVTQFQSCSNRKNSSLYCGQKDLRYGLYYFHIAPWLKIFPQERFLFLRTEDLAYNPSLILSNVWHFLSIQHEKVETLHENADKVIQDVTMLPHTKKFLDEFYQPYNQLLAHLLSDTKYLWNN